MSIIIKPCKFKCRFYRKDSNICKTYTSMCVNYRKLLYWFTRLEIIKNQLEGLFKKEKEKGGLNVNDNIQFDRLERELYTTEHNISTTGVKIKPFMS